MKCYIAYILEDPNSCMDDDSRYNEIVFADMVEGADPKAALEAGILAVPANLPAILSGSSEEDAAIFTAAAEGFCGEGWEKTAIGFRKILAEYDEGRLQASWCVFLDVSRYGPGVWFEDTATEDDKKGFLARLGRAA
tara:strand:- start:695 stop:1105 length:411 start_codon:yes stop_codon:yes gene_type:complete